MMAIIHRFRHNVSSVILWCAFLALYLGGALLLVIGLAFAARTWWELVHQPTGFWALATKTTELFTMAAGFLLILIIPTMQRRPAHQRNSWRVERRSEIKSESSLTD